MTNPSHDPHSEPAHHHDLTHAAHEEHGGVGKYLAVFLLLCLLTGASFFTYSDAWPFKDTPWVGWAFMLSVSCCKALLVMLFFMHLLYEADWKYVLTIPASIMSVFLVLMLIPDIGMRVRHYSSERLSFVATEAQLRALENSSAMLAVDHEHGDAGHEAPGHATPAPGAATGPQAPSH